MPLLIARSIAESVSENTAPAAAASLASSAARNFRISERTRVRCDRFRSAWTRACFARFNTDGLRFLTFVGVPAGIQFSLVWMRESSTVAEPFAFVKFPRAASLNQTEP
jgi:hypothetical protein